MQPYPFFGFPNFRRPYHYNIRPNYMYPMRDSNTKVQKNKPPGTCKKLPDAHAKDTCNSACFFKQEPNFQDNNCNFENRNTDEVFDFLGIKLASDDLLILALLFFLYKEDVKDPY